MAAEIIDAEYAIQQGVDTLPRTDQFRPPALLAGNDAVRGDAAEHCNHGGISRAAQPECHLGIGQHITVVQSERLRQPHGLIDLNCRFIGHVALALDTG